MCLFVLPLVTGLQFFKLPRLHRILAFSSLGIHYCISSNKTCHINDYHIKISPAICFERTISVLPNSVQSRPNVLANLFAPTHSTPKFDKRKWSLWDKIWTIVCHWSWSRELVLPTILITFDTEKTKTKTVSICLVWLPVSVSACPCVFLVSWPCLSVSACRCKSNVTCSFMC